MESTKQTPIEDQRKDALAHYEELSSKACHFSSFVKDAILAYNPVTEDKKAPVLAEEILKSKFIVDGKTYYEWPNIRNRNDIYPKILEAMQEHASNERTKAIQEAIQIVEKEQLETDDHFGYVACDNILGQLKLKTP